MNSIAEDRAALFAMFNKYGKRKPLFCQSSFANEVACVLNYKNTSDIYVIKRRFVDINLFDRDAIEHYTNYHIPKGDNAVLDSEAQKKLEQLVDNVEHQFPPDHYFVNAVRWTQKGLDPGKSYEHLDYIEKVIKQTVEVATHSLSQFVSKLALSRFNSTLSASMLNQNRPPIEIVEDITRHLTSLHRT